MSVGCGRLAEGKGHETDSDISQIYRNGEVAKHAVCSDQNFFFFLTVFELCRNVLHQVTPKVIDH